MTALATSPTCSVSRQRQPLAARRIVLVDDEPGIVETWTQILAGAGYQVQSFLEPAQALVAIAAGCDCVITDYQMPQMTGAELIREARPWSSAKFVVITGNASEAITHESMAAGACCVIHKPTPPPLLLQKLSSLCV